MDAVGDLLQERAVGPVTDQQQVAHEAIWC